MDWEHHFRSMSKSIPRNTVEFGSESQPETGFGSFLGEHTVDDLKHLIEAYDYAFTELEHKVEELPPTDPRTAEWMSEFMTLRERYLVARTAATKTINEWSVLPDSARTCEPEYQAVLRALQRNEDAYDRGDYQDLYNRLSELLKYKPVLNMPQPKEDFDTAFLKATSGVTSGVQAALNPIDTLSNAVRANPATTILLVGGGLLALKFLLTPARLFPGIPLR